MASSVMSVVFVAVMLMAFGGTNGLSLCETCVATSGSFYNAITKSCDSKGVLNLNQFNGSLFVDRAYDCPRNAPTYSDDFARNVAFIYAAASNGDRNEIQTCLDNRIEGNFVYSQYTLACDFINNNCSGYIAVNHVNETITVVFRGSKGSPQFYLEGANLFLYLSESVDFFGARVFTYFNNAFNLLWDAGINNDLKTLSQQYPHYKLQAFGHSLGGSLASLTALAAVKSGYFNSDNVLLYTFGQPRTGNLDYATVHDEYVPNSFRVVHDLDLIPQAPVRLTYYYTTAYHHRTAVFYNSDMSDNATFTVSSIPDPQYGLQYINVNEGLKLHLSYFNVDIDTLYLNGCVV